MIVYRNDSRYDPEELTLCLSGLNHKAREILRQVKRFTGTPNSVRSQAKDEFVKLYKFWKDWKMLSENCQDMYLPVVRAALEALDVYFFARSLTYISPMKYLPALEGLHVEGNIFSLGHNGYETRLKVPGSWNVLGLTDGWGYTAIYIDAFKNGRPQTIKSVLEILVHEMAHAIYRSFACICDKCQIGSPYVLGYYGHGTLWVEMMKHMMFEIQSWDRDLADFLSTEEILRHHRERP